MSEHHGERLVRLLKATAGAPGPDLVVSVQGPPRAVLRPVATLAGPQRTSDVRFITEWRNLHPVAFLSEFQATAARTSSWLDGAVSGDDSRILFMVDKPDGGSVGHMGLAHVDWGAGRGELDAIVRGEPAPRGMMASSLHTLIAWARAILGVPDLYLRVRSDNPAIGFYRKVGFIERRRVPLRAVAVAGDRHWREDPAADGGLAVVYMDHVGQIAED